MATVSGFLAGVLYSGSLPAQISPGALSAPHRFLEGPTHCTDCHRLATGKESLKCLECHTEIAHRLEVRRGYHAAVLGAQAAADSCVPCHSEHNGESFPLVRWDPSQKAFDHTKTGYPLEGKHLGLACQQCHSARHILPGERPNIKVKDLNRTFQGLSRDCITCHTDVHRGRLAQDCARCHNFGDWKAVAAFDHSKTRFPLTGGHARVACQKCHKPEAANPGVIRYFGLAFGKCADCHSDPHQGAFKADCESCHVTAGWTQVSKAAIVAKFDHAQTKYPLLGKHAQVPCEACHHDENFSRPLAFARCLDCHADPHHGQFLAGKNAGECAACHTVGGFKPSTFGVREHADTAYPLEGKHASVGCVKCHVPAGPLTLYKIKLTACKDCHSDIHQGQFAGPPENNRCESCHTVEGFAPSTFTLARHAATRFRLAGAHVAIPCAECHEAKKPPGTGAPVPYRFPDLTCAGCHADPHHGEFASRMRQAGAEGMPMGCETCHDVESWTEKLRFDHASTRFPLLGAHRAVACMSCHKPPNLEVTMRNVVFNSAPVNCHGCHSDPHRGQFAVGGKNPECSSCHDSMRWKPSLFDHDARTEFPLKGAHQDVPCGGCHKFTRLVDEKPVLFYKPTPKACSACHGPEVTAPHNDPN